MPEILKFLTSAEKGTPLSMFLISLLMYLFSVLSCSYYFNTKMQQISDCVVSSSTNLECPNVYLKCVNITGKANPPIIPFLP